MDTDTLLNSDLPRKALRACLWAAQDFNGLSWNINEDWNLKRPNWVEKVHVGYEKSYDIEWCVFEETVEKETRLWVAFQSTRSSKDIIIDGLALNEAYANTKGIEYSVHAGFYHAAKKIFKHVQGIVGAKPCIFIGHSLGGALATWMKIFFDDRVVGDSPHLCITFGAPKIGYFKSDFLSNTFHFTHKYDVVPMVPFWMKPNPGINFTKGFMRWPWYVAHKLESYWKDYKIK